MKKYIIAALALCGAMTVNAQTVNVWKNGAIVGTYNAPDKVEFLPAEKPTKTYKAVVSDLCGVGTTVIDGTFAEASFGSPNDIKLDPKDHSVIYMLEDKYNGGKGDLRRVNLETQTVETLVNLVGEGRERCRSIEFSLTGDTLYFCNQYTNRNSYFQVYSSVSYLLRSEDFKVIHSTDIDQTLQESRGTAVAVHPITGVPFYWSLYTYGSVYRLNQNGSTWDAKTLCFGLGVSTDNLEADDLVFSPDGTFAYALVVARNSILKLNYNAETQMLEAPADYHVPFAGADKGNDWADGVGTAAKIKAATTGCFVGTDFYFCDRDNQIIRKLAADGTVTTFAGQAGKKGKDNGDGLTEATFNNPFGICYDAEENCLYVADHSNVGDNVARCIRKIQFVEVK